MRTGFCLAGCNVGSMVLTATMGLALILGGAKSPFAQTVSPQNNKQSVETAPSKKQDTQVGESVKSQNPSASQSSTQGQGNAQTPSTQGQSNPQTPSTQGQGNAQTPSTQGQGNAQTPSTQGQGNAQTPSAQGQKNEATQTQGDENLPILKVSEVQDAITKTKNLIDRRDVNEINFNVTQTPEIIQIDDWVVSRVIDGDITRTAVYNRFANNPEEPVSFGTSDFKNLTRNMPGGEFNMVSAFTVRILDASGQTALCMAGPTYMNIYLCVNGKIEEYVVSLKKLNLTSKPKITVEYGQKEGHLYIGIGVMDPNIISDASSGKKANLIYAELYPTLDKPGISKLATRVVFDVVQ